MIAMVWAKVWPFIAAILFFGFLILSHEIGHFSAARAFRVRVNEFSLGMGPRLLKRKRGETLYSLKAIPFGGSVLMEGEDEDSEDPRSFGAQKPWKRFIILSAGALVNIVCGVLIMAVIVGLNPQVSNTRVDEFHPDSIFDEQGLETGDQILKIDGRRVYSWIDVSYLITRSKTGQVDILLRRGGDTLALEGVELQKYYDPNDESVEPFYYQDFSLQRYAKRGPVILKESLAHSASVVRMVYLGLLDLVTGQFKLSDMSGPIGVVKVLSDSAQEVQESRETQDSAVTLQYILQLLLFCAMISINIGIMNLLPLPALDGGRLLFCTAEMIFRKPIPKKFEAWVHGIGIILLMLLMVIISFSDIWGLITGRA